jgi:hypothetical protein
MGSGGIAPLVLNHGNRGKWSASRPGRSTLCETCPHYLSCRRLGKPQNRSGRCGVEKKFLDLVGIEP